MYQQGWRRRCVGSNGVGPGGSAGNDEHLACGVHVDGAGGADNDVCDVGDRFVRGGVGTIKAGGDGVVHGGAEHEDGAACEIDADDTGGGGIGNDSFDLATGA